MRAASLLLALLLGCSAAAAADGTDGPKSPRPNIILFYADDLGYTDLSCQGSGFYESPHIDRIGREGMTFTQAYAAAANCAPSRASLLTGLYTPRHGIFTVGSSSRGKSAHRRVVPVKNTTVLPKNLPTIAQVLKGVGYRTAVAGKWHVSGDPTQSGFDANFGGLEWGHPKSYFSPYRNPKLKDGPKGEHLPARLAKEVCQWIRSTQKPQPPSSIPNHPITNNFFLYLPFYSVHTPIQARQDLAAKYARKEPGTHHRNAKYAAMIEAMDLAVGQVLALLDELALADNTLVIFTSDNGPHGGVSNATPLRGSKGMYYEGGIREPFVVRWPGKIEPGSKSHLPIHQVDLLPTLAAAAGAAVPDLHDGVNLAPVFSGGSLPPRSLFWHFPAYLEGYGKDLGSPFQHFRTTPCGVIREGDWKLIEYFENGALELYNLALDPGETTDRGEENRVRSKEMHNRLKAWRAAVRAPVPTEKNPGFKSR